MGASGSVAGTGDGHKQSAWINSITLLPSAETSGGPTYGMVYNKGRGNKVILFSIAAPSCVLMIMPSTW